MPQGAGHSSAAETGVERDVCHEHDVTAGAVESYHRVVQRRYVDLTQQQRAVHLALVRRGNTAP